jgi:coenzyme F420 hydrogenase subunit beta
MGWPGKTSARLSGESKPALEMTYEESWGFLQKYRPFRCYLCPDLTAEFADISVGDPWYRGTGEKEGGQSLILLRTRRGAEIFRDAVKARYIRAEKCSLARVEASQRNLLGKRQSIWGRLLAMRLLGIPYPKIKGFHLFRNWMESPIQNRARSVAGTARRILERGYLRPLSYTEQVR